MTPAANMFEIQNKVNAQDTSKNNAFGANIRAGAQASENAGAYGILVAYIIFVAILSAASAASRPKKAPTQ